MWQFLRTLVSSSIGKKFLMALTGLAGIGFLAVHLGGNLVIYRGPDSFNAYAHFLHSIPLLFVFEIGLFCVFGVHVLFGVILAIGNWRSRPVAYLKRKTAGASNVASSTMVYSGLVVLAFMTMHVLTITNAAAGMEEYDRVLFALSDSYGAITYIFGVLALGFHLFHGASSTIQSLGIRHPKYIGLISFVGQAATVILAGCFASIPLYIWLLTSKGLLR